ncbi:N-acetylneuraminate lyase [soil metagenome]
MMNSHFRGLIAAPFTPFLEDGSLNLEIIPAYARFLKSRGVNTVFICGTTGEGASLSVEERQQVASAWKKAAADDLSVIVHVGHTSLGDARVLAYHASEIGATAIAALAPYFFKPPDAEGLVNWCSSLAEAAPKLPFYYYNIPSLTGVAIPGAEFLAAAGSRIPSLVGIKYTHEDLADYEACVRLAEGRFDMLFGRDELLIEGWARGARGAVGSTYNYASPLYLRLIEAVEAGQPDQARSLQNQAIAMIAACNSIGVTHLAGSKTVMGMLGVDCGPVRQPLTQPTSEQVADLRTKLEVISFFKFAA